MFIQITKKINFLAFLFLIKNLILLSNETLSISLSNLQSPIKPVKSNLLARDNSRNSFIFLCVKLDSKLVKIIIFLTH